MTASGEGDIVEAGGTRIWWRADGPDDAPPLMLVHSLGLDSGMWAPQVEALSGERYVVSMDLRGHGRSDAPPGPYSIERLALDVLSVADAAGLDRFDLCGLSIGGQVAQWLAIERPTRVGALVLANTAARIGTAESWAERLAAVDSDGLEPLAPTVLARWFSADIEDREPEHYAYARKRFLTTSPVGYAGCCAALAGSDLRHRVNAIDAPTLIVAGGEDVPTPPAEARRLHEAIGRSQLEIIAGAAHISNLDAEEQFTLSFRRFLKKHTR